MSASFYPPETTVIPVATTISFETFFWCISMCIATYLILLLWSMIGEEDGF